MFKSIFWNISQSMKKPVKIPCGVIFAIYYKSQVEMIMNRFEPNKWIHCVRLGVLQKGFEKNLIIQKWVEAQEVGHILEIAMCCCILFIIL